MFTDTQCTPRRLEVMLKVLMRFPDGIQRGDLISLLQPPNLLGKDSEPAAAKSTLSAAKSLNLVAESKEQIVRLAAPIVKEGDIEGAVLAAFDREVLCSAKLELYFALFYSYFLGLGREAFERSKDSPQDWADKFNQAAYPNGVPPRPDGKPQEPFNGTKYSGGLKWLSYAGLGWFDPADYFQANPYERIRRNLHAIFGKKKTMESDDFMNSLAECCPELDGGVIFAQANVNRAMPPRACTLGLSDALVELHLDGHISLSCPADNPGWSLAAAKPPRGDAFKSDKFVAVSLGEEK